MLCVNRNEILFCTKDFLPYFKKNQVYATVVKGTVQILEKDFIFILIVTQMNVI